MIFGQLTKNQRINFGLIYLLINILIQMLKKSGSSVANIEILDSFVANSRQGVQFNKQFVAF